MFSKFSGIDKNIVIFVLGGALLLGGIYFFFTRGQQQAVTDARSQLLLAENDSTEVIDRLNEIRESGTGGIDDLIDRIQLIEEAYPTSIDDLALASEVSAVAAANNVTLSEFSVSGEKVSDGALAYYSYAFSVTGEQNDTFDFLSAVQTNSNFTLTLGPVTSTIQYTADPETGTISNLATVTGAIKAWVSDLPPIALENDTEASADSGVTDSPQDLLTETETPTDVPIEDNLDEIVETTDDINDLLQ